MKNSEDSWVLKLYLKFNGNIDHVLSIIDETKSSSAISYYFKNNKWIFEIYFNEKPNKIIADRILMIKDGSKVFEGSSDNFFLSDNSFIKKFINSAT